MNPVLKVMDFVLKMMNFVLTMMDFVSKTMNFVLKMMSFALKKEMDGIEIDGYLLRWCDFTLISDWFPTVFRLIWACIVTASRTPARPPEAVRCDLDFRPFLDRFSSWSRAVFLAQAAAVAAVMGQKWSASTAGRSGTCE